MFDGTALEVVDDFQYLGAWENDTREDFQYRLEKVWVAFWKLKKFWDSNAPIKQKSNSSTHLCSEYVSMTPSHML